MISANNYTVYVNGEKLVSGAVQVDNRVLPLNGTFVVGQEQDSLSGKMNSQQILKGYVTQVNMWSYGLSDIDVKDIAKCRRNIVGDIFSSDISQVELINVVEDKRPLESFCHVDENFFIFPEKRIFTESRRLCHLVGSELFAPSTFTGNMLLNSTMTKYNFCKGGQNMWIGVTDEREEGTWRRFTDNKILKELPFAAGQPDNSKKENCMMVVGGEGVWADFRCNENNIACASCEERRDVALYLRGTCQEMKTKTMFEVLGYSSGKPYFHGFHGYMIKNSQDKEWILSDTVSNSTLAYINLASRNLYPIGRHMWFLTAPVCDQAIGSKLELSLSICNEREYMCDDGECISLDARCDDKDDCTDESDEDNCSILVSPTGYRSFKPPKNVEDASQPLQPYVIFQFLRFLKIEDVQQAISLEFFVIMTWVDSRLRYANLRSDIHANKLSSKEIQAIWKPQIEFTNVKDGELDLLKEDVFVKQVNQPLPVDYNAVNMGKLQLQ